METTLLDRLAGARDDYEREVSGFYDETLDEIVARVGAAGSAGKLDVAGLFFWKRMEQGGNWRTELLVTPEAKVREITADAVTAARDLSVSVPSAASAARRALEPLPGCRSGDALASAIIFAAAPDRMAVYDSRAHKALGLLGVRLTDTAGRYQRYMGVLEDLRAELAAHTARAWTARDVDLALFQLGR